MAIFPNFFNLAKTQGSVTHREEVSLAYGIIRLEKLSQLCWITNNSSDSSPFSQRIPKPNDSNIKSKSTEQKIDSTSKVQRQKSTLFDLFEK